MCVNITYMDAVGMILFEHAWPYGMTYTTFTVFLPEASEGVNETLRDGELTPLGTIGRPLEGPGMQLQSY